MSRSVVAAVVLLGLWMGIVVGCGSKPTTSSSEPPAPPPARGAAAARASADGGVDAGPRIEFPEQDFVETDRNRDPFRSFAKTFSRNSMETIKKQREVVLERYGIDELKLVGIVTGHADPRAMLIDPTGKGWIVHRGQFIGKEEIVHGKGSTGADYALNWRIDRIRDGDLVLVREDPAHPDVPPATRVIPLRPEGSEATKM